MLASSQQSWRWPLGWLYILTLGLDAGLAVRLVWMFFNGHEYNAAWFWFFSSLCLLLLGVGLLALILVLISAFQQKVGQALDWLGLCLFAIGSCAAAAFFMFVLIAGTPSVGYPPHINNER